MISFEPSARQDASLDGSVAAVRAPSLVRVSTARKLLRFGGFTMDTATGLVHWRGRNLSLAVEERELLSVLLRRAGQILSREHLATLLDAGVEAVDRRVAALTSALEAEGIQLRPRRAEGLGYILWR